MVFMRKNIDFASARVVLSGVLLRLGHKHARIPWSNVYSEVRNILRKQGIKRLSKATFHRLIKSLQWCHIIDVEKDEYDRRRRYIVLRVRGSDIFYPRFVVNIFMRFCSPWRVFKYYVRKDKPFYGLMFVGPFRLIASIFYAIRDEFEIALGYAIFSDMVEEYFDSANKYSVSIDDDVRVGIGINATCGLFRHVVETLCGCPDVSWFIWLYLRLLYRPMLSRYRSRFIRSNILLGDKLVPTRRKEHLVTPGEIKVLGFLMRVGVALWRDLFRNLRMSKSSLSYVLKKLETEGIIKLEEGRRGRKVCRIIIDEYHNFIVERLKKKLDGLSKRRDEKERIRYAVMWTIEALLHIFLVSIIRTLEKCGTAVGRRELRGDMTLNELLRVIQRYEKERQKNIEAIIERASEKFYDSLKRIVNIILMNDKFGRNGSKLKGYLAEFWNVFIRPIIETHNSRGEQNG